MQNDFEQTKPISPDAITADEDTDTTTGLASNEDDVNDDVDADDIEDADDDTDDVIDADDADDVDADEVDDVDTEAEPA